MTIKLSYNGIPKSKRLNDYFSQAARKIEHIGEDHNLSTGQLNATISKQQDQFVININYKIPGLHLFVQKRNKNAFSATGSALNNIKERLSKQFAKLKRPSRVSHLQLSPTTDL